jgi:chitinase
MLSFGGWGGCRNCSDVFAAEEGRSQFAESVREILQQYHADGIDLDWEFPAIEGYPGHKYSPDDKAHFTSLVQELRKTLGKDYELSFALGGFSPYLRNSIDLAQVMQSVDRVNVMSYDMVNAQSTFTGHHTPLFSTTHQMESADNAVRYLDSLGIPHNKIVIGAAFFARMFENVENTNHGLFQPGKFKAYITYKEFDKYLDSSKGFQYYWDSVAQAPYSYNAKDKLFATFDNVQSVALKTKYTRGNHLGGIMFWDLSGDTHENGLLEAIDKARRESN